MPEITGITKLTSSVLNVSVSNGEFTITIKTEHLLGDGDMWRTTDTGEETDVDTPSANTFHSLLQKTLDATYPTGKITLPLS